MIYTPGFTRGYYYIAAPQLMIGTRGFTGGYYHAAAPRLIKKQKGRHLAPFGVFELSELVRWEC